MNSQKLFNWLRALIVAGWVAAVVLLVLGVIGGCSTAKPYLEVGVGYRIDQNSDWYLRGERQWTGRNPITDVELGVDLPRIWNDLLQPSCGYYHWSSILDGSHNGRAELYEDRARCSVKAGGRRD